jgi:hypothetical protein
MIKKTFKNVKILQELEDDGKVVLKRIQADYKVTVQDEMEIEKIKK